MHIEIFRNFASPAECLELAQWAVDHQDTVLLEPQLKEGSWQHRRTSRNTEKNYTFPPVAYQLQNRIRALLPNPSPQTAPNGGKDGIIVISTNPHGNSADHIDPEPVPGVSVLRGNIIVQPAEAGGVLQVGGRALDIGVGDLHFYLVSRHRHSVSTIGGTRPRIIWLYGFCVNGDDWDSGRIPLRTPAA